MGFQFVDRAERSLSPGGLDRIADAAGGYRELIFVA